MLAHLICVSENVIDLKISDFGPPRKREKKDLLKREEVLCNCLEYHLFTIISISPVSVVISHLPPTIVFGTLT